MELAHVIWEEHGKRAAPGQIQDILSYKIDEMPESPINHMRDEIMLYIKEHRNMLSISCDGNCYGHTDGVVIYCHKKLMEDKNGR